MFNFVRKSSLFVRHWRHATLRASPTQQCLSLLSVRCISTTTKQQSSTVSYLINTCEFSPEFAVSLSDQFQLNDPVVSFFKSHGFCETQISSVIRKYPNVLLFDDPEKTLLPKLAFYYSRSLSTTLNHNSLRVNFLVNKCGFSLESARSIYYSFNVDKADAVISFLRNHGFSQAQIRNLVKKFQQLLGRDPEETILPKLKFFYSKGFSSSDFAIILSKYPSVLRLSLENHIIPNFICLSKLFESQEKTIAFIKSRPSSLNHDLKTRMRMAHTINILLEHGVPKSNISMYTGYYASPLRMSRFKDVVEEVKEMGINPLTKQFVRAVGLKFDGGLSWQHKVDIYKRWGWSEEEFLEAFRKYPQIMQAPEKKIMMVMDFFVNKMGLESSYIAKCPSFVGFNLHRRMLPRATVFQFLLTKGLIKSKHDGIDTLFKCNEKAFFEKFVYPYDEAPQLMKLYQHQLILARNNGYFYDRLQNHDLCPLSDFSV